MEKRLLTHGDIGFAASRVAAELFNLARSREKSILKVYPVPRGGIPALYLVAHAFLALSFRECKDYRLIITDTPSAADAIVDDIVDSGKTKSRFPGVPFFALYEKGPEFSEWIVFPWEATLEGSAEDIFIRLIEFCGEDPLRGGLVETPLRMAKAWQFWSSGYQQTATDILKTFEDGGENYDEMIHQRNIPFYSHCEHHLAPFFGTVTFAYIPNKRIVGLSKMNRLVSIFARRLQVQERLTVQIIDAFCEVISPLGAAITVRARHLCMESRGICQQGTETTTSALRGVFKEQPAARAEFLSLSK